MRLIILGLLFSGHLMATAVAESDFTSETSENDSIKEAKCWNEDNQYFETCLVSTKSFTEIQKNDACWDPEYKVTRPCL